MKKFRKISLIILSIIIIYAGFIYLTSAFNIFRGNIKGEIIVWSDDKSYEYFNLVAQDFMKNNTKCKIIVKKIDEKNYESELDKSKNKKEIPNIIQVYNNTIEKNFILKNNIKVIPADKILNDYKNNYSLAQIQYITIDNDKIAIPFSVNPIMLYLREDMLKEYGYSHIDIRSWDDVITIGTDIYNKSGKTIKILNGIDEDYDYITELLLMQACEENTTVEGIQNEVEIKMKELITKNIINFDKKGKFLARLSSIEACNEIKKIEEPCDWTANLPPAKVMGDNRFFITPKKSLVCLEGSNNNNELVERYIMALTTNGTSGVNYITDGNDFLAYLSMYDYKKIEEKVANFKGESPIVIGSNIIKKAPQIKNYDLYLKVKKNTKY